LLNFGGADYCRDDIVPREIFGSLLPALAKGEYLIPKTAGDFVTACMATSPGRRTDWPEMVELFLWPLPKPV